MAATFVTEVESESEPGKVYELKMAESGKLSCGCAGWRFSVKSVDQKWPNRPNPSVNDRWCKHLDEVDRKEGLPNSLAALPTWQAMFSSAYAQDDKGDWTRAIPKDWVAASPGRSPERQQTGRNPLLDADAVLAVEDLVPARSRITPPMPTPRVVTTPAQRVSDPLALALVALIKEHCGYFVTPVAAALVAKGLAAKGLLGAKSKDVEPPAPAPVEEKAPVTRRIRILIK